MVSINTEVHLPDEKVNEAIRDLRRFSDPSNTITYNDSWFAQSLATKWGMPLSLLEKLVKEARRERAASTTEATWLDEIANVEQLVDEGMQAMMYKLEGFLLAKNLSPECVEWFGEQIANRIKERHRAGQPTY